MLADLLSFIEQNRIHRSRNKTLDLLVNIQITVKRERATDYSTNPL